MITATLLGISTIGMILNGLALSILWRWFIVPTFELPALTILQATGVMLVVSIAKPSPPIDTKDSKFIEHLIAQSLVTPFVAIVLGFIVTLFL